MPLTWSNAIQMPCSVLTSGVAITGRGAACNIEGRLLHSDNEDEEIEDDEANLCEVAFHLPSALLDT